MIAPLIAAAVVGFVAAGRGNPRTRCEKKTLLGPRTGRSYEVEEFPDAGFLVVRFEGCHGVFQHVRPKHPSEPRFAWRGGKGPGEALHGMCLDLGVVKDPPAPQPRPAEPEAPATRKTGT